MLLHDINLILSKAAQQTLLVMCVASTLATSSVAVADEHEDTNGVADRLQLHLFGTLGASYHDEKGLEYRRNIEQQNGVSANQLDFSSDSILGAQADLQLTKMLSASMQLVSRNNAEGNWKPELITGFLRYQPNENIQIRLGRMPVASNVGSETRYASYAYTEVRPSPELYGLFSPLDRYDGISLEYTTPFASGIGKVLLNYGNTVGELYISQPRDIDHTRNTGIGLSWQKDNLEIRGLYNHYHIKNERAYEPIAQALNATPFPLAQQRAMEIRDAEDHTREVYGAAVIYTPGPWKFQTVIGGGRQGDASKLKAEAGSVLISYTAGQLTPYAIAAYSRARTDIKPSGVLNLSPQLALLNTAYNAAFSATRIDQDSLSLGVRYDFANNYALKFQVDKINADSTPFTLSTRTNDTDKDLTLFTIALDFLF